MDKMQWLSQLYSLWQQDQVQAILKARLDYELIDGKVLAYVRQWAQSAGMQLEAQEQAREIQQQVNVWAGTMGMGQSYGYGSSYGMGTGLEGMGAFASAIIAIGEAHGDPPMPRALEVRALDILQGRSPADQALELLGEGAPVLGINFGGMLAMLRMLGGEMLPVLAQIGMALAALALPRPQLLQLAGRAKK